MKRLFLLGLLVVFIFPVRPTEAQSLITRVRSLEINRKPVKRPYRAFLYVKGKEFAARRVPEGFVVPDELRSEESLDIRIIFGKYDLAFQGIPFSRLLEDWSIGVDERPFEEGLIVTPAESKNIRFIYYVSFGGTELIYTVFKNRAAAMRAVDCRKN